VWAFVAWTRRQSPPTPTNTSAIELLRQRYVRGEIDEPTFLRMQSRLTTPDEARENVPVSR
jgi:uncharacterized membrane protein